MRFSEEELINLFLSFIEISFTYSILKLVIYTMIFQ